MPELCAAAATALAKSASVKKEPSELSLALLWRLLLELPFMEDQDPSMASARSTEGHHLSAYNNYGPT